MTYPFEKLYDIMQFLDYSYPVSWMSAVSFVGEIHAGPQTNER